MRKQIGVFLVLFLWCVGCSTVDVTQQQSREAVFYPPEPEEPRIQYLTSISSSKDIDGESGKFSKFVLGEENVKSIIKPYGMRLSDGKLFVCDTVYNSLEVIDLDKKTFEYFQPQGTSQMLTPINVAIDSKKRMYVADSRRGQVLVFSQKGDYIAAIGGKGELSPTDVEIHDGKIFICDLKTHTVRVHELSTLEFRYSIPSEGQSENAKLFSPTNIDLDKEGNVYVSDTGGFNIKKYSMDGEYLETLGIQGDTPGAFARPKGIAVDRKGLIYVVDAAFENIQVFDADGNLLMYFPEQGEEMSLVLPAGLLIDYDHVDYFSEFIDDNFDVEYLILVSNQYGNRKISVFGFGRKK